MNTQDSNQNIDALKLKEELTRKFNERFVVNGKFSLDKLRESHKNTIRKGESILYDTVEEYETDLNKTAERV